jgi:type II secretory pathway component PulM
MAFADRMERVVAPVRNYIDGLNDRERRLFAVLGVVGILVFVILPMYLVLDGIGDRERENRELVALLRQFDQQGPELQSRKAERDAMRQLFTQRVPPLGGFLETTATNANVQLREVTDQPDQEVSGFRRHRVTAQFPSAEVEAMMRMLATVENSPFPVTVSRIEADRAGDGKYNFRIGVDTYEPPAPPARGAHP